MIELYTWPTPNGHKVHIALEELGLRYRAHGVNIGRGDQFEPDFLHISPNNKVPAIVDTEGPEGEPFTLFESGAILIYLADKAGKLLPASGSPRYRTLEWLMFQMGNLGPMLGQAHHFRQYAPERVEYGINRYTNEAARLYAVMDRRLAESAYLAGSDYSIADIACFPWIRDYHTQGQELADFPHLKRWHDAIAQRPAVTRGLEVLADSDGPIDDEALRILVGACPSRDT
jgi:GST-like protein